MTDRIPSELRTPVDGLPSSAGRTAASRRKKSTAPASRALTAGLSLAATAAIVAALALTGQQSATSAVPTVELDMASGSKLNGFADQVATGASDQAAVPAPGISPAESSVGTSSVPVGSPPPAQPMQVVSSASTQSTAASSTASPSQTVTAPPVTAAPATTVPPAPVTTVAPAPRTRAS